EFALGLMSGAKREDLPDAWEWFALPLVEGTAVGGGALPSSGSLLEVDTGGARLSNVRRIDGFVEGRLWNPSQDAAARATVGGREVELAAARIETVRLP